MKSRHWVFATLALIALILIAPLLWKPQAPAPDATPMPWQIELPAPGQSRVFGLVLGTGELPPATLAEARRRFSEPPTLALLAPADAPHSLEAYFDTVFLGPLSGKLLLTLEADAAALAAMAARPARLEYTESGVKKLRLAAEDLARAQTLPLKAIAFIPSASLDAAAVIERFGPPAERIRQGETLEHFLYPERGLDVVVDSKGREVLQYVAPAAFANLRQPLTALAR